MNDILQFLPQSGSSGILRLLILTILIATRDIKRGLSSLSFRNTQSGLSGLSGLSGPPHRPLGRVALSVWAVIGSIATITHTLPGWHGVVLGGVTGAAMVVLSVFLWRGKL